jgi:hypothetical protein
VPGLYRTGDEKKELETRNGVLQSLAVLEKIEDWQAAESRITAELLKELQYRASLRVLVISALAL